MNYAKKAKNIDRIVKTMHVNLPNNITGRKNTPRRTWHDCLQFSMEQVLYNSSTWHFDSSSTLHLLGNDVMCDFDDVMSTEVRLGNRKLRVFFYSFFLLFVFSPRLPRWQFMGFLEFSSVFFSSPITDCVGGKSLDLMQQFMHVLLVSKRSHSHAKVASSWRHTIEDLHN